MPSKVNVLIVTKSETSYSSFCTALRGHVGRTDYAISMTIAKQKLAAGNVDLVLINTPLPDEFGVESALQIASHHPRLGVMLLVKEEIFDQVNYKIGGSGIMVITRPVKAYVLITGIHMMVTMLQRQEKLMAENTKLRKRLEEMGVITRAKCLLIEKESMTEEGAHYYLEKLAMDSGCSKKEVAEDVIARY